MSKFRHLLGRRGEDIAASYLLSCGFALVTRNYACRRGELDLVVREQSTGELVFVEVKTRRSASYGVGEESITPAKSRRLWLAALDFLDKGPGRVHDFRFDLIVVDLTAGEAQVRHHRNFVGAGGSLA